MYVCLLTLEKGFVLKACFLVFGVKGDVDRMEMGKGVGMGIVLKRELEWNCTMEVSAHGIFPA